MRLIACVPWFLNLSLLKLHFEKGDLGLRLNQRYSEEEKKVLLATVERLRNRMANH